MDNSISASAHKSFKRLDSGEKFPKFLELILVKFGFDCESALLALSEKEILEIEKEFNSNQQIRYLLDNTVYAQEFQGLNYKFKFRLGHRAILLNIPKNLEKSIVKEKQEKKSVSCGKNLSEIELKNKLSAKLIKFYSRKNFKETASYYFSSENLQKPEHILKRTETHTVCTVQCPWCVKRVPCNFYKYWQISNFTKHLKLHEQDIAISEQAILRSKNDLIVVPPPKIVRVGSTAIGSTAIALTGIQSAVQTASKLDKRN